MRVGILTSWRVPCGIYQYSARLADALARIDGVEPVILAGRADEHRSVPEESQHEVHDVTGIGLWRNDQYYWLDTTKLHNVQLDVIHVQYQSMLFTHEILLDLLWQSPLVKAITFHDNCQRPDFPYEMFDLKFSHRWNVGPSDVDVIPFGIENRPPVVRTFGLGRSQIEVIQPICERNGWVFESASTHETIHGGGQAWRSHEELIQWLRGADAIVLWYPEVDMAGASQAARTAIASRRPVITNNTKWFEDLPDYTRDRRGTSYYNKVQNIEELEVHLDSLFARHYVEENSWDRVAQLLVDRYSAVKVTA